MGGCRLHLGLGVPLLLASVFLHKIKIVSRGGVKHRCADCPNRLLFYRSKTGAGKQEIRIFKPQMNADKRRCGGE